MKSRTGINKGIWYASAAYALWGMFPIYWKWLHHVPAPQLLCHRILWSFLWLIGVVVATDQGKAFRKATFQARVVPAYLIAALLIGVNWLTYVWAVNAGFIVETSLGYFINPLLSVLIGVLFLRERLRRWQWLPVALAAAGILCLTYAYGAPPWIALILASTWATYGLIKKVAPLGSLHGLTLETGLLFFPVVVYLIYCEVTGRGVFFHAGLGTDALLIGAGVVTTIPLFLFASAVQRIPLSVVGILQYIAPIIQFLIGVLIYKEPFTGTQFIGFGMVWMALIIFGAESVLSHRAQPSLPLPE